MNNEEMKVCRGYWEVMISWSFDIWKTTSRPQNIESKYEMVALIPNLGAYSNFRDDIAFLATAGETRSIYFKLKRRKGVKKKAISELQHKQYLVEKRRVWSPGRRQL